MSIHSPLHRKFVVFAGRDIGDLVATDFSEAILKAQLGRETIGQSAQVQIVCIHRGPFVEPSGVGAAIHVNIDLPEIVVSPVLGSEGGLCVECYNRRRRQHSSDPRIEPEGSIPAVRPSTSHLPITEIAKFIIAERVIAARSDWESGTADRYRFSLYRTSINQLVTGSVLPHSNCVCGSTELLSGAK